MPESVYIETTIVSYLTARPSRNIIRLAHEMITEQWWATARGRYQLVTSELVLLEAAAGDPVAAAARLKTLRDIPVLTISDDSRQLAASLARAMQLGHATARTCQG